MNNLKIKMNRLKNLHNIINKINKITVYIHNNKKHNTIIMKILNLFIDNNVSFFIYDMIQYNK